MDEDDENKLRRKGSQILLGAAIGIVATVVALVVFVEVWPSRLAPNGMTYQDLISIVLTALAVLMAVLGAFVALLAIWGYAVFERLAKEAARNYVSDDINKGKLRKQTENLVTEYLKKESSDEGMFRQILIDEANRIMLSGRDRIGLSQGVTSDDEDEGDV